MASPYTGRTTDSYTLAVLNKTSASAAVTAVANTFSSEDVGRSVTGTGIAAGTTILSVQSDTAATLSANATATNAASAVLGQSSLSATGYFGWSPETVAEAKTYTFARQIAGDTPPDRITSNTGPKPAQRYR